MPTSTVTPVTPTCVCVIYNGYVIVPSPMVSISRSFKEDPTGRTIGATLQVKLEGKIVAAINSTTSRQEAYQDLLNRNNCLPPEIVSNGIGISVAGADNLMNEERAFRRVFTNSNYLNSNSDFGTAQQYPGTSPYIGTAEPNRLIIIAKFMGGGNNMSPRSSNIVDGYAKVTEYSANQTPNNWTQTIDYTVGLEIDIPVEQFLGDTKKYLLSSVSDDLSIEPIEESNLFNIYDPIFQGYFGSDSTSLGSVNNPIWWTASYPAFATRYRISRTIEAVGKHSFNEVGLRNQETVSDSAYGNAFYNAVLNSNTRVPNTQRWQNGVGSAFLNAREYVLDRLRHYPTQYFLYNWTIVNRVRSIAPNEVNGSFRVTETSMAVDPAYHPAWSDDWTAEVSVDNTFMQTVRINGTIKGFETYDPVAGTDQYELQYGARPTLINNIFPHSGIAQPLVAHPSPDAGNYISTPGYNTPPATIYAGGLVTGKYQNAMRGLVWLKGTPNPVNNPVVPNSPYYSPIVNRARLFFNSNTLGANYSNPYVFLNNQRIINERLALSNINPAGWNNPAPLSIDKMNPIPTSMTESHRMHVGEIDYSFEFNNRPLNLVNGSVSENLSISDTFPTQQIAEIFVLGRKLGPVLQDLGTVTASTREVTFEIALPRPPTLAARLAFPIEAFRAATGIVEQMNPKYIFGIAGQVYIKSFVKTDNQSWNPMEGRLTITKSWVWQRAR